MKGGLEKELTLSDDAKRELNAFILLFGKGAGHESAKLKTYEMRPLNEPPRMVLIDKEALSLS